ncbi:hypothetical protein [Rhizobium bangladeshense]|uniref:hypothetical protein n=1 Tax=Rhizobium bangladeshense TaxID=1138189 RepID=UPI002180B9D0|nr:hypothetical protein [Rhizobium bangladeshense]
MLPHIHIIPTYRGGDPAPKGYLEWHEWARVQLRAGLRQAKCQKCGRYKFPQELSGERVQGGLICTDCFTSGGADAEH